MEIFSRYWPFVRGIHRWPVNSPHKRPVTRSFDFFSLICTWINGWINNGEAGDLRCHRTHYDCTVMSHSFSSVPHHHQPNYDWCYFPCLYRMSFLAKLCLYCHQHVQDARPLNDTWNRHQMKTFSALLALCAGNSPVTGEILGLNELMRGIILIVGL